MPTWAGAPYSAVVNYDTDIRLVKNEVVVAEL